MLEKFAGVLGPACFYLASRFSGSSRWGQRLNSLPMHSFRLLAVELVAQAMNN